MSAISDPSGPLDEAEAPPPNSSPKWHQRWMAIIRRSADFLIFIGGVATGAGVLNFVVHLLLPPPQLPARIEQGSHTARAMVSDVSTRRPDLVRRSGPEGDRSLYRVLSPAGDAVSPYQAVEVSGSGDDHFLYVVITPDGSSDAFTTRLSKSPGGMWRANVAFGSAETPNGFGFTLEIVGSSGPLDEHSRAFPASAHRLTAPREVSLENPHAPTL